MTRRDEIGPWGKMRSEPWGKPNTYPWGEYRSVPQGFEVNGFCKASIINQFTAVYRNSGPVSVRAHLESFDLFLGGDCEGCGKPRDLKRVIGSGGRVSYLCEACEGSE